MPNKFLKKGMISAFLSEFNQKLNRKLSNAKSDIRKLVFEAVYNSPAMTSIRGGTLKLDFGLPHDPTYEISSSVSRSISARFKPFKYLGGSIFGSADIMIQPNDYFELLSMPESIVITEKGEVLPWLDWLLNYGDQIIIADFGVKYSEGKGRSGGAIMIPNSTPFRVDPRYAGINSDNFIVRALNGKRAEIERQIWRSILS